jgi:hypothetical protein
MGIVGPEAEVGGKDEAVVELDHYRGRAKKAVHS